MRGSKFFSASHLWISRSKHNTSLWTRRILELYPQRFWFPINVTNAKRSDRICGIRPSRHPPPLPHQRAPRVKQRLLCSSSCWSPPLPWRTATNHPCTQGIHPYLTYLLPLSIPNYHTVTSLSQIWNLLTSLCINCNIKPTPFYLIFFRTFHRNIFIWNIVVFSLLRWIRI